MPLYVYECSSCDRTLEVKQKFSDPPLTKCECGGSLLRVIFATPAHYKVAGFYTSDNHGLKGYKRKPEVKVGLTSEL